MGQVEDFLDSYAAAVEEVPICGRPALFAEHQAVEAEMLAYHVGGGLASGVPDELIERQTTILDEIDKSVMVFRLSAIPRQAWADLIRDHPPTDEQRRLGYLFDPEPFTLALIEACAVEPKLSAAQVERMQATLPQGEWDRLAGVAIKLNQGHVTAPKRGLLSAFQAMSGESWTTPQTEESLEASSLDGRGEQ